MTDRITELTIRASLGAMFKKGWVDICTIKECLKLAGVTPIGHAMNQLQALHCVSFKDMDRELAEAIPMMVAGLFEGVTLNVDDLFKPQPQLACRVVDITPESKPRTYRGFMKLLGTRETS